MNTDYCTKFDNVRDTFRATHLYGIIGKRPLILYATLSRDISPINITCNVNFTATSAVTKIDSFGPFEPDRDTNKFKNYWLAVNQSTIFYFVEFICFATYNFNETKYLSKFFIFIHFEYFFRFFIYHRLK